MIWLQLLNCPSRPVTAVDHRPANHWHCSSIIGDSTLSLLFLNRKFAVVGISRGDRDHDCDNEGQRCNVKNSMTILTAKDWGMRMTVAKEQMSMTVPLTLIGIQNGSTHGVGASIL